MLLVGQFKKPQSALEKLENFLSQFDHRPKYIKKGVYRDHNVQVILNSESNPVKLYADADESFMEKMDKLSQNSDLLISKFKRLLGDNLIGDQGDKYYAQRAAGETATIPFHDANGRQELGNGTQGTPGKTDTYSALQGPVAASRKTWTSGYPKTNDADADNTGAGVDIVTWLTSWTKADFNATGLSGGVIHNAAGSPVAGSNILTYWTITAFNKTADDTLKIFINHNFLGV